MYLRDRPFLPGAISMPTLVAMMTLSRPPRAFSQLPMMVSDSPPLLPGCQREYTSAVSMKLKPAATNASSSSNEIASSAVQPKTLPPKVIGQTCSEDWPSWRFSI